MSAVLRAHLWKEWREQRAGLAGLALVLLAASLVATPLLPRPIAGDFLFVTFGVAVALTAFLLSVGSEVLPGELARDRLRFLRRLPPGLSVAFAAKLVFFVAAGLAVSALGLALAFLVALLRTGALPSGTWSWNLAGVFLPFLAVALWTPAVSTWVPRSTLALPTTIALIAVLAWPLWLGRGVLAWYDPDPREVALQLGLLLAAAPVAAWSSFVLGYRAERPTRRAFLCGLGAAALLLAPAWAWTGLRLHTHLAPAPEHVDLGGPTYVDAGGRYAFLTDWRRDELAFPLDRERTNLPWQAYRVDLADGSWRFFGNAAWIPRSGGGLDLVDSETGGVEPVPDGLEVELAAVPPPFEFVRRYGAVDPNATADGPPLLRRAGLGFRSRSRPPGAWRGFHDPFRGRGFGDDELQALVPDRNLLGLRIRPGRWLLPGLGAASWQLFDPESGELAPAAGLVPGDRPGPLCDDGRLFVLRAGRILLVDPETGDAEEIDAPGLGEPELLGSAYAECRAPALLRIFVDGAWRLARYDAESARLRLAAGSSRTLEVIHFAAPDTVLVVEDAQRIVRLHFGSDEREVLFPRED